MRLSENTSTNKKLDLLDAAYGLGPHQAEWLRDLGETMRHCAPGAIGCFCYEVVRVDGRMEVGSLWAEDPEFVAQIRRGYERLPASLFDLFYATPPLHACTSREILEGSGIHWESTRRMYAEIGLSDVFAVMAGAPSGHSVVLGVGLQHSNGPSPRERVEWVHVAAHVAAALRLRTRLDGDSAFEHASAVLNPDGRVEHIANDEDPDTASILRTAVKQVEYARRQARSDAEALALWQGLVDGRWSLVEQFESDGRRYYVAVRNPTEAIKTRALTRREAEVAAYVAKGTTTKVTAYALGLDEVTVRGYLRTAMTKLGLRSRAELVALRATLEPHCRRGRTVVDSLRGPHSLRPRLRGARGSTRDDSAGRGRSGCCAARQRMPRTGRVSSVCGARDRWRRLAR